MRKLQFISLPLVLGVTLGVFLFSPTAHAQTPPTGTASNSSGAINCLTDPAKCQSVKDEVWAALDKNITPSAGMSPCTDARSNYGDKCGMSKASSDGVTEFGVPWKQGDMVKCYRFAAQQDCAITHNPGTTQAVTEYHATGAIHDDNAIDTSQGAAPLQGATGNASNTLVGQANSCVGSGIGNCILQAVGSAILGFANFLLGIAGVLFNLVMVYGVFQFGNTIGNSPGVLTAWGILRDIANMALLFGFIFMGVATILDTGGIQSFTAKNALPKLLIFAILMNFSLFCCEAIIDVSNALTSSMYSQANTEGSNCYKPAGTITGTDCGLSYGLSGHIMQSTGLSGIWASGTPNLGAVQYFMLALFSTIGAIVFFAASIMLAIRLIILTLLMIVSPIGFAGLAIPPLRNIGSDWWKRVIHQSFYAPVMLLLILISLKIADNFTTTDSAGGHANNALAGSIGNVATNPNASTMGVVLVFMIIIGFLVASLIAANKIGAVGANGAINFGKKIVLGSYGKVGGVAGRNSIGRLSNWSQKKYEGLAGRNKGFRKFMMATNLDDAVMGMTAAGKKAKFGGSASFDDKTKKDKERNKLLDETGRKAKFQKDLDAVLNDTALGTQAKDDRIADILDNMSVKEMEELDVMKKSGDKLDQLVRNLSSEKFAALVKEDGKLTDAQKKQVRDSRFKDILDQEKILDDPNASPAAQAAALAAINQRMKRYSVKDLENGPPDLLSRDRNAQALNNKQREDLLKNGKLNSAAARQVRRFDPVEQVNSAPNPTLAAQAVQRLRLNPKQVARLNDNVLNTREMASILSPKMLQAIQERNELDDTTVRNLKRLILQYGTPASINYVQNNPAGVAYWS